MATFQFTQLDNIRGCTILLDIDGTISFDGKEEVSSGVAGKITELRDRNDVYLISNKKIPGRLERMAHGFGVSAINTPFKKPSLRALGDAPRDKPFVVIGDKFLTDGILAKRLGAEFFRVSRLTSPEDGYGARMTGFLDDFLYAIVGPFIRI